MTRKNSRYNQELSLNTPLNEAEDNYHEFIDCLEAPEIIEEEIIKLEKNKELRKALAKLTEEDLELVFMVYYNKVSIKTYADEKGLGYPKASIFKFIFYSIKSIACKGSQQYRTMS